MGAPPPAVNFSVSPSSLTAYLPLSTLVVPYLGVLLQPFINTPSPHLKEVVLLCPDSLVSQLRPRLLELVGQESHSLHGIHTDFLLKAIPGTKVSYAELFREASESSTDWVLILDERGIDDISEGALLRLWSTMTSTSVFPSFFSILPSLRTNDTNAAWRHHASLSGWPQQQVPSSWPKFPSIYPTALLSSSLNQISGSLDTWNILGQSLNNPTLESQLEVPSVGHVIVFLLPSLEVVQSAMRMTCGFQAQNYTSRVLVYDRPLLFSSPYETRWQAQDLFFEPDALGCDKLTIFRIVSLETPRLTITHETQFTLINWLDQFAEDPQVLFASKEDKPILDGLFASHWSHPTNTTRIYIPEQGYRYSDWIGTLSIQELQNWYAPSFTFSIITYNRPHSLLRLLNSLSAALYFGEETLSVRINIEKEADDNTKAIAQNFSWNHGPLHIYQRVVHSGLLPAIVEAWYPSNNDSYGLLLEDDIELSPLFYAWIKMTTLKYRYGSPSNKSPNLFGVSLYQQRHLELPMKGRQPFNARNLFFSHPLISSTNTPYLSAIPCSWGAVYFPEHWRHFHAYLSTRFHANVNRVNTIPHVPVVPNVRSNKWTHSWKKFFIELVYLHGYVMLYPNFADFTSLSTNHLEVGSHVGSAASPEKRMLFILPLMSLPLTETQDSITTGLLDLPDRNLPDFRELPVLNLTGSVTDLESLVQVGQQRRDELWGKI